MGRIRVKVVPGSSRDALAGWLGDALKVKVRAPPEKGRANRAVEELVAAGLGLDPGAVEVVAGHSSPSKVLSIRDWDEARILAALRRLCP